MKKTFNINVAGFPFTIDEDAYNLLNDYLDTIERAFRNHEDSQELITDIESRVAELLLERTSERESIVTADDVTEVIRRVGKPEEMISDEEDIEISETNDGFIAEESEKISTPPPFYAKIPPVKKKLYRDPQTGMLGGVCSGIAWYLNCDPTWVRLAAVLITIGSLSVGSILYIILWIVLPEPRTPLDRIRMMGEQPTVENIGKTVTDNFMEEKGEKTEDPRASASPAANGVARTFGLLARILVIIGLIVGIPLLIALCIGFIGCLFFLIMYLAANVFGSELPWDPGYQNQMIKWGVICGIGGILALGVPIYFLVRKGMTKKPLSSTLAIALSILCAIGFLTAAVATGVMISEDSSHSREVREWHRNNASMDYNAETNQNDTEWIDDWQTVDPSNTHYESQSDSTLNTAKTDSVTVINHKSM